MTSFQHTAQSGSARLILGTVQLGLEYGIANTSGRPSQQQACEIVSAAYCHGVALYDTAQAYGESEKVLGAALRAVSISNPKIISKLSPSLSEQSCETMLKDVSRSLKLLDIPTLHCLMLHREEHLPLLDGEVGASLQSLVDAGVVNRIGVSVYTVDSALAALDSPLVSVLQLPASLFDRRFESAGVFAKAAELGKEIHIRSALLQGVLCMAPETLPPFLQVFSPYVMSLRTVCLEYEVSPAVAALAWVMNHYPHAYVLFGAETAAQVVENAAAVQWLQNGALMARLDSILPPQNEQLLSPIHWSKE